MISIHEQEKLANNLPISYDINVGLKDLSLTFWLRPYTIEPKETYLNITQISSTLYLRKNVDYSTRKLMSKDMISELSFSITPINIYDVQKMFDDGLSWFTKENLNLLYERTSEGTLIYNSEYNGLNSSCIDEFGNKRSALQLMPMPISIGYDKQEPGIILYVNRKENHIKMTYYQFKKIANFILHFDFISYTQFMFDCYNHALWTGKILSKEEMAKRAAFESQYNTNFKQF